ncbi:peptidase inhibitor family I36 protein [Amycolatopsis sp. EV170708-02-1]|uniref:peptidase inhibitor family I36 protein n=1 Tax=Amycolatopsis sp. EV170708-02-1 TaxID=2919322 RepID=UPI0037BFC5F8
MFVKMLVLATAVVASSLAAVNPVAAAVPARESSAASGSLFTDDKMGSMGTRPVANRANAPASMASAISVFVVDGKIGSDDYASCPVGRICVYAAPNGGGVPGWKHFGRTMPGSCTLAVIPTLVGLRGYLSAYNRTGTSQKLWTNRNCTGTATGLGNESIVNNLGSAHWSIGG